MKRTFAVMATFFVFRLPGGLRESIFRRWKGWEVHPTARVGLSIVEARILRLGAGTRIGHFTVIRDLLKLDMSRSSSIGQWNWISAAPILTKKGGEGTLLLGAHSTITSRHYLDCSSSVTIGSYTTIAGVRSTILTHQIDTAANKQVVLPVNIGNYCFVGSNVSVTPGTSIVDRCVIAMGAVVANNLETDLALYGGVPARLLKTLEYDGYFRRSVGRVDP